MMIVIELLIFLSTILPVFHLINALVSKKRRPYMLNKNNRFSILIPCFNEEDTVQFSVSALLHMDYDNYEVIYINDGSKDDTLGTLHSILELCKTDTYPGDGSIVYRSRRYPNFLVIDKPNGGKSDALNAGIALASSGLIVTLDADSVLEKDALQHMSSAFENENVVAAGGSVHIIQGYNSRSQRGRQKVKPMVMLQILEYLKGFYIYKMSLSKQRAMTIVSGAFGVFRKDILIQAGGYRRTLGEDIDITIRIQQLIHKTKKRILFIPKALCYTQCPENWHDLKNQRIRWQKGFIDCIVHYKRFLFKTFLYKSLSFHFLIEAMTVGLCSCLFTIFTYVFVAVLAFGDLRTVGVFSAYYLFCLAFNIIYSISALAISVRYNRYPKRIVRKAWLAIMLDILFYRYFNLFMYLGGTILYFWNRKSKDEWKKVSRIKREYSAPAIQEGT